jgi:hypothetical protein
MVTRRVGGSTSPARRAKSSPQVEDLLPPKGSAPGELRAAFEATCAGYELPQRDSALIKTGRTILDQIDAAVATGDRVEVTKALYLTPHLLNILRELLATPAARKAAGLNDEDQVGGKLAKLRSTKSA